MTLSSKDLRSRYLEIQTQVPSSVTFIAVSKKQPVAAIQELYALGHRDFGENYAQEMVTKAKELENSGCSGIRWHFIGHLQTNKIKMILPYVFSIHAVDSENLASQLAKQIVAGSFNKLPVFIEVNLDNEKTKSGVAPEAVWPLADVINSHSGLFLQGLMCIPKGGQDPGPRFKELKTLEKTLGRLSHRGLSMGMSGDYVLAIREGATHIRVGTALFGDRPV